MGPHQQSLLRQPLQHLTALVRQLGAQDAEVDVVLMIVPDRLVS
jgi:hypothetical protein